MVDRRFFGHYFWKVEGTVHIHVNSRVARMWLAYTVIIMQGGGIASIGKLGKFGKLQFWWWWGALAVILDLMSGSHLELLKMAAT